ncbi:MAG: hypothetical protein Q8O86_13590 [Dehalococcoidia bacterium]|nr:hypothetical protein [Dehalococcoidia bacterium]
MNVVSQVATEGCKALDGVEMFVLGFIWPVVAVADYLDLLVGQLEL